MESDKPEHAEVRAFGQRPAPQIAKDYWRLADKATILDVMYQVRADEDNHKKVNHCFADLNADDMSPFSDQDYCHKMLAEERAKSEEIKKGYSKAHHEHIKNLAEQQKAASSSSSTEAEGKSGNKH